MIIKTKIGKNFSECVRDNLDKDNTEVLYAEGVRMDSSENMTADFNHLRKSNPDLGNAVWHTSLYFALEDKVKVSDELMVSIAIDYTNNFKLEQYAVIRHIVSDQVHFHIIANRVGYDGKTISDQFCANKGVELARILEKKYDLTQQVGKRLEKTHREKLHGKDIVKYEIYEAVNMELPKCKSIEDLQGKLQIHGINTIIKPQGLSFSKGKIYYKASAVDKSFGLKTMLKTIEKMVNV